MERVKGNAPSADRIGRKEAKASFWEKGRILRGSEKTTKFEQRFPNEKQKKRTRKGSCLERVKGNAPSADRIGRKEAKASFWEKGRILRVSEKATKFEQRFPNEKQKKEPERVLVWSGWRESNPRGQLGKLKFCHWTTPAYLTFAMIFYHI